MQRSAIERSFGARFLRASPIPVAGKSYGNEISAAATADGGAIVCVRADDTGSPTMWESRSSPGAASWAPLSRGHFPLYVAANAISKSSKWT